MKNFKIYTDGACKGNPGKGGFAYMVYDETGAVWYEGYGTHEDTTNNKMELYAAIEALRVLSKNQPILGTVEVFSDSAYMVNCFEEDWISRWEKNGWLTRRKENVINKEYWLVLKELVDKTKATFARVPRSDKNIKKVDEKAKWASKL